MKQKTIGALILAVVVLAALSIPQGFAKSGKSPHGTAHGTYYMRTSLRGVSNAASASPSLSPASCGDLGFTGKSETVVFYRGAIAAQVQNAKPNTQYSVWLGYKTSKLDVMVVGGNLVGLVRMNTATGVTLTRSI